MGHRGTQRGKLADAISSARLAELLGMNTRNIIPPPPKAPSVTDEERIQNDHGFSDAGVAVLRRNSWVKEDVRNIGRFGGKVTDLTSGRDGQVFLTVGVRKNGHNETMQLMFERFKASKVITLIPGSQPNEPQLKYILGALSVAGPHR